MKTKKNIDNLFKSGISGFRTEPSDQVWQNIVKGFFEKKKFVFFKWYYLAAVLLLLLTAGSIWFFNMNDSNQARRFDEIVIHDGNQQFNNESKTEITSNTEESLTPNKNAVAGENTRRATQHEETKTGDELAVQPARKSKFPEIKQPGYRAEEFIANKTEASGSVDRTMPPSLYIVPLDAGIIGIAQTPAENMINPAKVKGMEKYLEKQRKGHFYTGASFNGEMVYYPSTPDQFTSSANLRFGTTIAGKFFIETGIGYRQMKERGIYTIELRSYDSVGFYNKVESFEVNPSNPDEILYNTKEVTVYDSIKKYTHTTPFFKYQYINVPLSVGFKFLQKGKFTVSAEAGVVLSMLSGKNIPEAEYYDPEYTVVRIHNKTPQRVDWNLIGQIGIRLDYKLYKSLSLSAEPVFSKYLNPVYDTDKGYPDVKPYMMGLRIGMYYGF